MVINKTTCVQHDTLTKNQFIGAMEATGKLHESAAKYGIKPSAISNLWTNYKNMGTTKNLPHCGCPPKLSDHGRCLVVQNCVNEHQKPFQQITHDTMMNISEHTVHDVAADAGYHQRDARKVPFLPALQKRKRLAWANEFRDFGAQEWRNLIWSDECYIHIDDKSGQVYVTCWANEKYDENCVIPTFKQSSAPVSF